MFFVNFGLYFLCSFLRPQDVAQAPEPFCRVLGSSVHRPGPGSPPQGPDSSRPHTRQRRHQGVSGGPLDGPGRACREAQGDPITELWAPKNAPPPFTAHTRQGQQRSAQCPNAPATAPAAPLHRGHSRTPSSRAAARCPEAPSALAPPRQPLPLHVPRVDAAVLAEGSAEARRFWASPGVSGHYPFDPLQVPLQQAVQGEGDDVVHVLNLEDKQKKTSLCTCL